MPITTRSKYAAYVGELPTYSADPTGNFGSLEPGGTLTITLPTVTGISHWKVLFKRLSTDFIAVHDNLPPDTTTVSYIYVEDDVGEMIEPEITAVPSAPRYEQRIWTLEPKLVEAADPIPSWPADISASLVTWSQRVFESGQGKGRMVISASAPANPSGYELTAYHGTSDVSDSVNVNATFNKTLTELGLNASHLGSQSITWDPSSGAPAGKYDVLSLGYKSSGGVFKQFAWTKNFRSTDPSVQIPTGSFPAANQELATATATALRAALDARITNGSTSPWYIDLPDGDYGAVTISDKRLPGLTYIRSKNRATMGAKMPKLLVERCSNLVFQFIDHDRTNLPAIPNDSVVRTLGCTQVHHQYCRVKAPTFTFLNPGYAWQFKFGFELNNAGAGNQSTLCSYHMCHVDGPGWAQFRLGGCQDITVSDCVGSRGAVDFIHIGWGNRVKFLRNWGPRTWYPSWSESGGLDHMDFIQLDSQVSTADQLEFTGNVMLLALQENYNAGTVQGIFGSKCWATGAKHEQNIIMTNCVQGIWLGPSGQVTGGKCNRNTILRLNDRKSSHTGIYYQTPGLLERNYNIQQHTNDDAAGANGLNIDVTGSGQTADYSANLDYFEEVACEISAGVMSSIYDCRPKTGTAAHIGYSGGEPLGAAQRYADILAGNDLPNIGPAYNAWKQWYDPRNQIAVQGVV